jgi:hypothetical protein
MLSNIELDEEVGLKGLARESDGVDLEHFTKVVAEHIAAGRYGAVISITDDILGRAGRLSPLEEATVLDERGRAYRFLGRATQALTCLREALRAARAAKNPALTARILTRMTMVYADTPEREEQERVIRQFEAVVANHAELATQFRHRVLHNLGVCCEWSGDLAAAKDAYERCIAACRQAPENDHEFVKTNLLPRTLTDLSGVLLQMGRPADAVPHLQAAHITMSADGLPMVLAYEAWYRLLMGDLQGAEAILAHALLNEADDWCRAEQRLVRAQFLQATGDVVGARNEAHLAADHAYRSRPEHVAILHRARIFVKSLPGGWTGK